METCGKPFVAAVNGFALGGGCELAMACHIRIASENAKFGQPEVKLGIITGYAGSQRLPRIVGKGRALQLLLTGEMTREEASHRTGQRSPQADLLAESEKWSGYHGQRLPPWRW
jgi:enoyl-CoA hydratase